MNYFIFEVNITVPHLVRKITPPNTRERPNFGLAKATISGVTKVAQQRTLSREEIGASGMDETRQIVHVKYDENETGNCDDASNSFAAYELERPKLGTYRASS